jgi:hypothetical protein
VHENIFSYSGYLDLHPKSQKTRIRHFPFALFLASRRIRQLKYDAGKQCDSVSSFAFATAVTNDPLVVTQFIETMGLLHVQGPKSNI